MHQDLPHIGGKLANRLSKGVVLAGHRVFLEDLDVLLPDGAKATLLQTCYYMAQQRDPMNVAGVAAVCQEAVLAELRAAAARLPGGKKEGAPPPPRPPELTDDILAALIVKFEHQVSACRVTY